MHTFSYMRNARMGIDEDERALAHALGRRVADVATRLAR